MKYAMIATWKMAFEGVEIGKKILAEKGEASTALEKAICCVEDNPAFTSVGYGGLPNINGEVELDAAYMNGKDLSFGAICSVKNIKNPIKVAQSLSVRNRNCYLSSLGAEEYAHINGFEFTNMLTPESATRWQQKRLENYESEKIEAYGGHDTMCMIALDQDANMGVGVSTSGLFMKQAGRVGDSPVIGSGFYCDNHVGGAAATGVGEDIMKGCLSIDVISRMKNGASAQQACEEALTAHYERLTSDIYQTGSMSLVALDRDGNFGAATTKKEFPFVVTNEHEEATIFVCKNNHLTMDIVKADEAWLNEYIGD